MFVKRAHQCMLVVTGILSSDLRWEPPLTRWVSPLFTIRYDLQSVAHSEGRHHDREADRLFMQAKAMAEKEYTAYLHDGKKSAGSISRAVMSSQPRSLAYAERDMEGPEGQPKGSIATDPVEVDRIATRVWQKIYEGQSDGKHGRTERFVQTYCRHMHSMEPITLQPISEQDVRESFRKAPHNAGGLDGWLPEELHLLPDSYHRPIANLLNLIEDKRELPVGNDQGRLAYLEKDPEDPYNPKAYRLLTILPVLYRRWASMRLGHIAPWTTAWGLDEIFAGVGSSGAEDAWMGFAVDLEKWQTEGTPFCGGATDLVKCFDQVDRGLLLAVARRAGMPILVLETCRRYMETLRVRNTIAGGVGAPYSRTCGIPQ